MHRGEDKNDARAARSGPERGGQRTVNLIGSMRAAFDDAEVQGWEALEVCYGLPDPDDERALAA